MFRYVLILGVIVLSLPSSSFPKSGKELSVESVNVCGVEVKLGISRKTIIQKFKDSGCNINEYQDFIVISIPSTNNEPLKSMGIINLKNEKVSMVSRDWVEGSDKETLKFMHFLFTTLEGMAQGGKKPGYVYLHQKSEPGRKMQMITIGYVKEKQVTISLSDFGTIGKVVTLTEQIRE